MEAFSDALDFFGKLAADDKCGQPMVYLGTTGAGMMIVHGEREFFGELIHGEEFRGMFVKAGFAVPDIAYEMWGFGDYVGEMMSFWAAKGAELGLM